MSKFRNRNIRNKFDIPITVESQKDRDRTVDSGIDVKPSISEVINKIYSSNIYSRGIWNQVTSLSSCGSSDIEIIDDHGFRENDNSFENKSTASSLSWGEDYETHATELVKEEYERMERVLQYVEPIPSNYDRDEYKLWIQTFPSLRLTGRSSSGQSTKSKQLLILNEDEKHINNKQYPQQEKICDRPTSNIRDPILNFKTINSSVIDKRFEESPRNYKNLTQHEISSNNYRNYNSMELINSTINPSTLDLKFDSFLTISAAPLNSFRNNLRLPSSTVNTSLNKVDKSLPYLPENLQINTTNPIRTKNFISNSDFTILPPIDVSANNYKYRSISAANRTKSSVSAFSLKSPVNEVDNFETNSISFSENGFNKKPARRRRRFVDL